MNRLTRLSALVVAVAVPLLLAACDGRDTATASAEGSSSASASTVDAPTSASGSTAEAAFPRTVTHAMGETEIPAKPERVVVLDTGELDTVAALGMEPVGAVRAPVESGLLEYLADETADTELVGTIDEPDLELIATLEPDLILSSKLRHEALYDELSAIAPTVFTETVGVVWKDNLLVHAEALGLEAEAQEMLDAYEQRAAELGERIGDLSVSVVRFLPGSTRLYQKASFIGTILQDVGLPRPASQDVDDFALEISPEQIGKADADVIFYTVYGPADDTTKLEITGGPLWKTVDAVKAGRAYPVSDDHWMLGIGIKAANLVLDDLEQFHADGKFPPA